MKNIACLIVALPALLLATSAQEIKAQNFPSTGLGGFDGSVVEAPNASVPLPGAHPRAPMMPTPNDTTNLVKTRAQEVMESFGDVVVPARRTPAKQVGGYQTVFDRNSSASAAPASTRSRSVAEPTSQSPLLADPSPIITVDPEPQLPSESSQPTQPRQIIAPQSNQLPASNQLPVQSVVDQNMGTSIGQGCADGACPETYAPVRRVAAPVRQAQRVVGQRSSGRVFSTVGASGLLFNRNYGENVDFSANNGNTLSSEGNEFDTLPGIDVFVTRRRGSGLGWEGRYFGLYPEDNSTQIGSNPSNLLPGLGQIGHVFTTVGANTTLTGPSASDYFDLGDPHVLTRQTELHNIEFNLLRNGIPRLRACQTEYLLGFRYIQFGETLLAESVGITGGDPAFVTPESIGYFSTAENNMYGIQIGARSDYRIQNRLMLHMGIKAGAFNNNINTRQRVDYRMPDGSTINPTVAGGTLDGRRFDFGTETDVKSLLLELDVSLSAQVTNAARVRVGYRGIGVTDVAFASEQIRDDFNDANAVLNPTTDSTLVLQGTYIGLELAY